MTDVSTLDTGHHQCQTDNKQARDSADLNVTYANFLDTYTRMLHKGNTEMLRTSDKVRYADKEVF